MTTISPGHATPFGRFVHGINRHHLRAKWAVPAPGQQLPLDLDLAGASAANGGDAASPRRLGWANLLARVFAVDVTVCRKCGGRMRVLDVVRDPPLRRACYLGSW